MSGARAGGGRPGRPARLRRGRRRARAGRPRARVAARRAGGGGCHRKWRNRAHRSRRVVGPVPGWGRRDARAKSAVLAVSRSLSSRAAQTLVLFMTSVLIAVLLVAPQPAAALGWQLLAVGVVSGVALFILDRRAGHGSDRGVARYIEKVLPPTRSLLCSLASPGSPSCSRPVVACTG